MAKVLAEGKVEAVAAAYSVKIEDSKMKVAVEADLAALVDKAAAAVPGDSPLELLVVGMIKQGVAAL